MPRFEGALLEVGHQLCPHGECQTFAKEGGILFQLRSAKGTRLVSLPMAPWSGRTSEGSAWR